MADKADRYPYVNTIGGLSKALLQFRNSFPTAVDAKTLQKLNIAPNPHERRAARPDGMKGQ